MTALADLDDLLNRLSGGAGTTETVFQWKYQRWTNAAGTPNQANTGQSRISLWMANGNPSGGDAAPSTAVAPTNATIGAVGQANAASGDNWLVGVAGFSGYSGMLILYDRLSHQGGLVGNVNTAQTTNLPTAALTRYTSGSGLWAWMEVYDAIGSTSTTFTVSYTNEAGTAGRTSVASQGTLTTTSSPNSMYPIPLQAGDRGIRSIESFTLAASTGTAGNIGVTIAKPLAFLQTGNVSANSSFGRGGSRNFFSGLPGIPKIETDACLAWLFIPSSGSVANDMRMALTMVEA